MIWQGRKWRSWVRARWAALFCRRCLKNGLLSTKSTCATVAHEERAKSLAAKLKVKVGTNNVEAAKGADIIVIGVKPQVVEDVVREISAHITSKQVIVSVAASVPTSMIEKNLPPNVPVIRAMPNTPCLLGAGMTAICKGKHASAEDVAMTCHMFDVVGRTVVVDEKHMDAVTALSASGPAYIYIILESLAEGGSEGGTAAGYRDAAGGADHDGRGPGGARDGRSSGAAQGRRDYAGRLHHRRDHGTRGRQVARHADQSGGEGGAAGEGTGLRLDRGLTFTLLSRSLAQVYSRPDPG